MLRRTRTAGERADRVMIHPTYGEQSLESAGEYEALAALARRGLRGARATRRWSAARG